MVRPGRIVEFNHVAGTIVARLFNFDIAQDRLKLEHRIWLSKNVVGLLRNGGSLWIMGLTSTTGQESFNTPLSQRRAESVVAFLRGELSKNFPFKLDAIAGMGEMPARIAGLRNNIEDENWRAVVVGVWDKPVPPPPPPPPPPPLQQECKRLVLAAANGVSIYVFYSGRGIIGQVSKVKASPDYTKCATDFEREWSFLVNESSHPVVTEYQRDPGSNVVGEVVGHHIAVNRFDIVADKDALRRLPAPYYAGRDSFNIHSLSVDELLNGYVDNGSGGGTLVVFNKVPLYLNRGGHGPDPRYHRLANSSEEAENYQVVTDVYGQILLVMSSSASRYPRNDSSLRMGVKTTVTQTVKVVIKSLIF
jgi:hypothetical protein